jgi:hypothetical protein
MCVETMNIVRATPDYTSCKVSKYNCSEEGSFSTSFGFSTDETPTDRSPRVLKPHGLNCSSEEGYTILIKMRSWSALPNNHVWLVYSS